MSANVALTDTFDQWRVKTNEVVVMTQTDGMSNFIKLLDTTNSTSNTTGSIITAGGIGIAKSVVIGEHLRVHGNVITDGDTTISGNLIFGDATTDQVTFTADINSNIIPNANLTFNIGNTLNMWANSYTGHLGVTQKTDSGKPAITIASTDTDQIAVDINASQVDGDVLDIAADSVTTAKVIDITADALTTGSALYIDSDSSSTGTRNIASVIQNHVSATGATALSLQADAGRGLFIDSNLAAGGYALEVDAEITTTNTAKIAAISTSGTTLEVSSVGVLTGKVIDITADAATTGTGINMSMDGLTTGSALVVDSDSSSTGTRNIASITQNHASATGSTVLALQADAGRGLFIDNNLAAGGPSLEIDSEQVSTNCITINSDPATTGTVIDISADGLTTGGVLKIDSDSSSTGARNIVEVIQNHTSATGSTALAVQSDAGKGIFIDSNLAAGGYALQIDAEITTTNTAKIDAISTSGTTLEVVSSGVLTGKVIDITADNATTGTGINMSMDGLTTGTALKIDSTSSSTDTRSLATIQTNHASATGSTALTIEAAAGRGLFIDSNLAAGGFALEIDSELTTTNTAKIASAATSGTTLEIESPGVLTGTVLSIGADGATTGTGINMSMDGLTTGSALAIDSDSSSTATRNIASIIQNHSSASGSTTLYLQNDHTTANALKVVGAVQVGVDDTGHDVKFFGASAGKYALWDESADELQVVGKIRVIKGSAFQTGLTAGWVLGG